MGKPEVENLTPDEHRRRKLNDAWGRKPVVTKPEPSPVHKPTKEAEQQDHTAEITKARAEKNAKLRAEAKKGKK